MDAIVAHAPEDMDVEVNETWNDHTPAAVHNVASGCRRYLRLNRGDQPGGEGYVTRGMDRSGGVDQCTAFEQ
jgi:hypothetical protein